MHLSVNDLETAVEAFMRAFPAVMGPEIALGLAADATLKQLEVLVGQGKLLHSLRLPGHQLELGLIIAAAYAMHVKIECRIV